MKFRVESNFKKNTIRIMYPLPNFPVQTFKNGNMKLSDQQKEAFQDILRFLKDPTHQIFVLKGYAGSGKTSLLRGLGVYFQENNIPFRLAAPTGRAAKILSDKTACPASTIHKLIYNFDKMQFNEKDLHFFFRLKTEKPGWGSVLIFDEASMIGDTPPGTSQGLVFGSGKLLSDILEYCAADSENEIKIIFVGDDAQLPPITDPFSKALMPNELHNMSYKVRTAMLTEVFRTLADHPVLKLGTQIRQSIQQNVFDKIEYNYCDQIQKLRYAELAHKYSTIISDSKIVICWSNRMALTYSRIIREKVYGRTQLLEAGDRVMIAKNNYTNGIILFNGSFAEIISLSTAEVERTINLKEKGGKKNVVKLRYRDAVLLTDDGDEVHAKVFMNFIGEPDSNHFAKYGRAMFVDALMRAKMEGIEYCPNNSLKNEMFSQWLKRDPYYNCLILKYGYAITCHKAQGGAWEHVFLDINQLTGNRTLSFFKWVYTAVTRSSDYLYLIDPPELLPFSEMIINTKILPKGNPKAWYVLPPLTDENNDLPDDQFPFLGQRNDKLEQLALKMGWALTIKHMKYQVEYKFQSMDDLVVVRQYYTTDYFRMDWNWIQGDLKYKPIIGKLLYESMYLSEPPPPQCSDVRYDFYELMHEFCLKNDIRITNILLSEFGITIYLITDNPATECLAHKNKKNLISSVQISALQPDNDIKLEKLMEMLQSFKES